MARPKGKAAEKAKPKATVGRKPRVATKKSSKDVEKENEDQGVASTTSSTSSSTSPEVMYSIMRQTELKESLHKRYVKEMQQLYTKVSGVGTAGRFIWDFKP